MQLLLRSMLLTKSSQANGIQIKTKLTEKRPNKNSTIFAKLMMSFQTRTEDLTMMKLVTSNTQMKMLIKLLSDSLNNTVWKMKVNKNSLSNTTQIEKEAIMKL